ncbi:DNA methylase [Oribacterium sp. C9]|uniref:Y-family DNA polymerase n=1 Tax=Oribacterium sp. C9 TaxID=1943579 RepID=UPI00098F2335|nr:DNA methylase [Oribacterium sp. C9]OON85685.1 DNA methylase [Oribacterium sp. C9]
MDDTQNNRCYMCIDLKSFYASVECYERDLDPLTTNLVVADVSRTEKTICLAVTPSLKAYGIPGRARLFQVIEKVKTINAERQKKINGQKFSGKSCDANKLKEDPFLELDYISATPHMAQYIKYSTKIYDIYLKYVAPEDIHVYSIDEVFMDVTAYLRTYAQNQKLDTWSRAAVAERMASDMIHEIIRLTGITATAGIGTNMYLAKIAMDIVAKHIPANKDGVRIAMIDERSYRQLLWNHRPLTDFWRVGVGYARKLESLGLYTMGDVARCSLDNEELLYKNFGINAELLIDHVWGYEPCRMQDVKAYKPENSSMGSGQVLHCAYNYEKSRLIIKEMADQLSLDLVAKHLVTDQLVITIGYDIENLTDPQISKLYHGPVVVDYLGRRVPKHAHGTISLQGMTSSTRLITGAAVKLFEQIVNPDLLVRRLNIVAGRVKDEKDEDRTIKFGNMEGSWEQMDLFSDYEKIEKERKEIKRVKKRDRRLQEAALTIKQKFGKNAVIKGMNMLDGATMKSRNEQIGGHKA